MQRILWVWSVMVNLNDGVQFYLRVIEGTCLQDRKNYEYKHLSACSNTSEHAHR